jgi:hypothetical protein
MVSNADFGVAGGDRIRTARLRRVPVAFLPLREELARSIRVCPDCMTTASCAFKTLRAICSRKMAATFRNWPDCMPADPSIFHVTTRDDGARPIGPHASLTRRPTPTWQLRCPPRHRPTHARTIGIGRDRSRPTGTRSGARLHLLRRRADKGPAGPEESPSRERTTPCHPMPSTSACASGPRRGRKSPERKVRF